MNAAVPTTAVPLRQLRLKPGMFLQVQSAQERQRQSEAKFCAAIDGKGLMLVPLQTGSGTPDWREGSAMWVRGFTGQYDFSFPSRVLGNFSVPFAYVLLSYPPQVEARQVRSAQRIRTSIMAMAWGRDAKATVPARLVDLSTAGAMLELSSPLGGIGDPISLAFSLEVDGSSYSLELRGSICHASEGVSGAGTRVGVAFAELPKPDRMLLQNFTLAALQDSGVVD